jgi:hypothetical protein
MRLDEATAASQTSSPQRRESAHSRRRRYVCGPSARSRALNGHDRAPLLEHRPEVERDVRGRDVLEDRRAAVRDAHARSISCASARIGSERRPSSGPGRTFASTSRAFAAPSSRIVMRARYPTRPEPPDADVTPMT